jgi:hypothetical protein
MGINTSVSTATTPGLLTVEQPDVQGTWEQAVVVVECVWGFSNQLTYGDYNEVTVGGYFDICFGVLLEVVLGATVEVISPLAVEVIYKAGPLQPALAALGSGPAMSAASAAGWEGRTKAMGADVEGLQFDVVFGNYYESVSNLTFRQKYGDVFEFEHVKTVVAATHTYTSTAAHQECIGAAESFVKGGGAFTPSGAKTLVSETSVTLSSVAGPLLIYGQFVKIASSVDDLTIGAGANLSISATTGTLGGMGISAVDAIDLQAGTNGVAIGNGQIEFSAPQQTFSSGSGVFAGPPPLLEAVTSSAEDIIKQAERAAQAAKAWAAGSATGLAAMRAWSP